MAVQISSKNDIALPEPSTSPLLQFNSWVFQIKGVGSRDVYNITQPINVPNAGKVLLGRIEKREDEFSSEIGWFRQTKQDELELLEDAIKLPLQDPQIFENFKEGKHLVSGVRVFHDSQKVDWRREFYLVSGPFDEEGFSHTFAEAPMHIKGLVMIPLSDDTVLVVARPQGIFHGVDCGPGAIAIAKSSMGEISSTPMDIILADAKINKELVANGHWCGVNAGEYFKTSRIVGILGHEGWITPGGINGLKNYIAITFLIDAKSLDVSPAYVFATRRDFPQTPVKEINVCDKTTSKMELENIYYPGGYTRQDGTFSAYGGLSDAASSCITRPDVWEILDKASYVEAREMFF